MKRSQGDAKFKAQMVKILRKMLTLENSSKYNCFIKNQKLSDQILNDVKINFLIDLKPELESLNDSGTVSLNISTSLRTSSLNNFNDDPLV